MTKRHGLVAGVLVLILGAGALRAEDPIRLEEKFPRDYQYQVKSRVTLEGKLTVPGEKGKAGPVLDVRGDAVIGYVEKVLDLEKGMVNKSVRVFDKVELRRKIGEQEQATTIRAEVRRQVILRKANREVPFSPDGPLLWEEIDLVRTDVFTPALAGLLPDRPVKTGDSWEATSAAVQELTDYEKAPKGQVKCTFNGYEDDGGRKRYAVIGFRGTVQGQNEDGESKHELQGTLKFDLDSNHVSSLTLLGTHTMLDASGKEVGVIKGKFYLTRQANTDSQSLTANALRGVVLDPNDDNTLLVYDNKELGVKFLYPRRWRVGVVRGAQVALDAADGNGLLLTVEPPGKVPTAKEFLTETRNFLLRQKVDVRRTEEPTRVQDNPRLDRFRIEAAMGNDRFVMDYYVADQGRGGGATIAARLLPNEDLARVQKEVEQIARSLDLNTK